MKHYFYFLVWIVFTGCSQTARIDSIWQSSPARNALKFQVDFKTPEKESAEMEYWKKDAPDKKFRTSVSASSQFHHLVLTNLDAKTNYVYRIWTTDPNGSRVSSREYPFTTQPFPIWIQDSFRIKTPEKVVLPDEFKTGYVLLSRRDLPGIIYLADTRGKLRWYHQVNGTGFKTSHFTKNKTIISILGTEEYPTSYGNEILELSLQGDTLFHLKKGEKGLDKTVHHEVILNNKSQIVTLTVDQKIMDLRSIGGTESDTVKSDGILILDRNGRKVWNWSIFDHLDALTYPNILKEKSDWMHANSLSIDNDGNYLMSFYNNGQVWKINAATGAVMWKFGKGGDFEIPKEGSFTQGHAVHRNKNGELMLFDNGTEMQLSRSLSFRLDEKNKKAELSLNIKLPKQVYSARMGSSYMIHDDTVLHCSSKTNTIVLTDVRGKVLWQLSSTFAPYRAEFISGDKLVPFISK
jgi:hypothetical protein